MKYYNNFPFKLESDSNVRPSIFSDEIMHNYTKIERALKTNNYENLAKLSNIPQNLIEKNLKNIPKTE